MTPDLIFGIAICIIALLVLCALIFAYLGNASGQSTQLVTGLFVVFCALIIVAAIFFGEHVRKENNHDLLYHQQELEMTEEELQNELLEVLP
jgi:heme/copper-type cytochrome/quinol oxidase subunit 4